MDQTTDLTSIIESLGSSDRANEPVNLILRRISSLRLQKLFSFIFSL